jgi:teichuronic acid biosynthesis glycosyltransferase TuaG
MLIRLLNLLKMNSPPKISIVMPAYNAERYIKNSIDSVLMQTLSDFELLIINDCSKDNTAEIVKSYMARDERIRLIDLPVNMGAPAAPRNVGIKQSLGKWIAFLDSDDIWHPTKLQRQIELLERTGASFCSTKMLDFIDQSNLKLFDAAPGDYEWITFSQQLIKLRTPTSSVVAKRELMINNLFNEDISYKAREDLDCWLHCHEEIGQSVKINIPMMGYRIIPGQISGKKWIMVYRHFNVLRNYRYRSGKNLGLMAWFYTFTHFSISIYHRAFRKQL